MDAQLITHVEDVGSVYTIGDIGFRIEVSNEAMEVISRALSGGLFMIEDVDSKVIPDAVIDPRVANKVAHELLNWEAMVEGRAKANVEAVRKQAESKPKRK